MKTQILEYLEQNPHTDGIGVALGLNIKIADAYHLLGELERDGFIEMYYVGIYTRYRILRGVLCN